MAPDWSMLPLDPLGAIAMKFTIVEDFIRFSAVCRGWHHATSLVEDQWRAPLPSLLLAENTKQNPDCFRKILDLNNHQIYQQKLPDTFGRRCWGSPYGWVAIADDNRNVQLFNPITKAQIHFPSLKTLKHYKDDVDEYFKENHKFVIFYLFKLIVLKVSQNDKHEFVLMVIYKSNKHLDFARQGDESWTSVSTKKFESNLSIPRKGLYTRMIDVVARNDDIFALYDNGAIVRWHARDFCSGKLLLPTDYSPPQEIVRRPLSQKYLVECHGDLFLVLRYKKPFFCENDPGMINHYETKVIDVFKLTQHGLEKIEELRNVALFVGVNHSMSISVGVGQRSGIYFTDDEEENWEDPEEFGGHDTGFYDMKLNEFQFFKYDDMRSLFCPSTWFIPNF